MQSQFYRFNVVLDISVGEQSLYGGVQAMLFSDCAYINAGHSLRGVAIARAMMRKFIDFKVPVRMGIGKGTFYDFEKVRFERWPRDRERELWRARLDSNQRPRA